MSKKKCMHCNNTNLIVSIKEFRDNKNNKWIHTNYYCNNCKFHGTHSTRRTERNNVNPKK